MMLQLDRSVRMARINPTVAAITVREPETVPERS